MDQFQGGFPQQYGEMNQAGRPPYQQQSGYIGYPGFPGPGPGYGPGPGGGQHYYEVEARLNRLEREMNELNRRINRINRRVRRIEDYLNLRDE